MIDQEKIHQQCLSNNPEEHSKGLKQLRDNFSLLPDKQKAWEDLHRLTSDQDIWIRMKAAEALGSAFSYVPDKQKAWDDLHRLTLDQDDQVRFKAVSVLDSVFSYVPDKQKVWDDLHRLTLDQDDWVRGSAASVLGFVFPHIPDKQKVWDDLCNLTLDPEQFVSYRVVSALGSAFPHVPDKQKAWENLHRLTEDLNINCRYKVASVLGSSYSHVPDKQEVWDDLTRLTSDQENIVRIYANHSLGKISIFQAAQAKKEEDYKNELEKAIEFFEKAAQESIHAQSNFNPSQFCLPLYRSYYTIVFKKQEAKGEVDKCLREAKDAVKGSKSKELLLEAVNNLSNALKEVQNQENHNLEVMKEDLNFYRQYCDRASELLMDSEEAAPYATGVLKKGLPILDRNLKGLLEEIQNRAKSTCKGAVGTDTAEIACAVSREVQKWEIGSQEEMAQKVEDIAYLLKTKVANLPENEYVLNKIEAMRHERNLIKQYESLLFVIGQIPTMKVVSEQELDHKLQKLDLVYDKAVSI